MTATLRGLIEMEIMDVLEIFVIIGVWLFLTRYLFPKMGIQS